MAKIIKNGGHCYDGCGWTECSYWKRLDGVSKCMMFGGEDGIKKSASVSLNICNKIYGLHYEGDE